MITVEISNQPISGLKRKVEIKKLIINKFYIEMEAVIKHYVNNSNAYGVHLPKFDIMLNKNTIGSFIDANTGLYTTQNIDGTFPDGVVGVAEIDALKSTDEWTGIINLLSNVTNKIDLNEGYDN